MIRYWHREEKTPASPEGRGEGAQWRQRAVCKASEQPLCGDRLAAGRLGSCAVLPEPASAVSNPRAASGFAAPDQAGSPGEASDSALRFHRDFSTGDSSFLVQHQGLHRKAWKKACPRLGLRGWASGGHTQGRPVTAGLGTRKPPRDVFEKEEVLCSAAQS